MTERRIRITEYGFTTHYPLPTTHYPLPFTHHPHHPHRPSLPTLSAEDRYSILPLPVSVEYVSSTETHPAPSVPELRRLHVLECSLPWGFRRQHQVQYAEAMCLELQRLSQQRVYSFQQLRGLSLEGEGLNILARLKILGETFSTN